MLQRLKFNVLSRYSTRLRFIGYVQGQELEPGLRAYFYFINQEGMVFLDDTKIKNFTSCFKDKQFLRFFFSRIRPNKTNLYRNEFPFFSLCGRERNFIRCYDVPIVFSELITDKKGQHKLCYTHSSNLLYVDFQPEMIYMDSTTGRVYHPAWKHVGNIGLVGSKLAIEISERFEFDDLEKGRPTHFIWNRRRIKLQCDWVKDTIKSNSKV